MIFVTVGTHEQQFNRLVKCVDDLKRDGEITEDIFIQTGFSTYEPKYCKWSKFIPFQEMNSKIKEASIVITHGGPSSFIAPLQLGKIPVVVPRSKGFEEHVNNHQVDFCNAVAKRQGNIIVVNEIEELARVISNYEVIVEKMPLEMKSNNEKFINEFEKIIGGLGLDIKVQ